MRIARCYPISAMPASLDSAKRKLARAKDHILDFEQREKLFWQSEPCRRVIEPDSQRPDHSVHKLKWVLPIPEILSEVAGDATNNLRSALDHTGRACSVGAGVVDPQKTHFPFSASAADLENVIKGRCKHIPPEALAIFRAFQPYMGGNDLLYALNAVCNRDKHEILVPIVSSVERVGFRIECRGYFSAPRRPTWDGANQEMVLLTLGPETKADYDLHLSTRIAFGEVEALRDLPALGVLDALSHEVEHVLVAIEAEGRRMGWFV